MRDDLQAGLTVAVLLVPQSLAYAALAGLPPVTGLYTALGSLLAYAALGASPYVSAGPSAVTALLVASSVTPLAGGDAGRAVALGAMLALMAGAVRLSLGLLRAGGIINVVSQPVLVGFTAGAGVIIAFTQVPDLLGMQAARAGAVPPALLALASSAGTVRPEAAAAGLTALVVLLAGRRIPRVPVPLLVVGIAAGLVALLDVPASDVPQVGPVPQGLPLPGLPVAGLGEWRQLLGPAVVLGLVGYVEGATIAKSFALRDRRRLDANRELVAHGASAVAAGLLGGFAGGGSFSRSALARRSGARTRRQGLVAAAVVVVALLVLPDALQRVPRAVLAAVVLYAIAGLFDLPQARRAMAVSRADTLGLAMGFALPVLLGVDLGFLLAAVGGLLVHLYRGTRARVTVLGLVGGRHRNVQRWPDAVTDPHRLLLRIDDDLTFLNADAVADDLTRRLAGNPGLQQVVLDLSGVARVDATGLGVLTRVLEQAVEHDLQVRLAELRGPVRDVLVATGVWDHAEELVHPTTLAAVASLDRPATQRRASASPQRTDPPRAAIEDTTEGQDDTTAGG